jgi:hypothetical protein
MRDFLGTILVLLPFVAFYVCVRAFFSSIKRSAVRQEPREKGLTMEFLSVARMQFLVRLVLALLVAFAILFTGGVFASGEHTNALLAPLIPMSVFVLILLVQPVPVVLDQEGIRQRRWFLHDKEIKWADIASVAYGTNTGTTYVLSKNGGPKIRFSIFLVGRARFKHEIRVHARNAEIYSEDDD